MAFGSWPISFIRTLLLLLLLLLLFSAVSSAQNCSTYIFPTNREFDSCGDLPVLGAHLHWSYRPQVKTVEVAFRATQTPTGWIAWGINPSGQGMVGTQAMVAFRNSNGSMTAYTTPITSYSPSMQPEALSFRVSYLSAEYANDQMTIYAVIDMLPNATDFSHVWQAGSTVSGDIPQMHATSGPNVQSMGTIDFLQEMSIAG